MVRVGTSGSMQSRYSSGQSELVSTTAVGFDNLMSFYSLKQSGFEDEVTVVFNAPQHLPFNRIWLIAQLPSLGKVGFDLVRGNTATCIVLCTARRTGSPWHSLSELLNQLSEYSNGRFRLTNFEMETASYYAFGRMLGHDMLSLECNFDQQSHQRNYDQWRRYHGWIDQESIGKDLTLMAVDSPLTVQPPSTTKVCPVMCLALSDNRNSAALAISWTDAGLPRGVNDDHISWYDVSDCVRSVSVAPGAMAFTRMRYCESSTTKCFVRFSRAAFGHAISRKMLMRLMPGNAAHE